MIAQTELDFTTPREPERHVRLPELIALLREKGRMTRRALEEHGFTDRELREIVESDVQGEILSFPGSNGYALFDDCPLKEIDRGPEALISQGKRMIRRGLIYRRRHHHHPAREDYSK